MNMEYLVANMETLSFQSSLDFCFYVVEFLPYELLFSRFQRKVFYESQKINEQA